MNKINQASAKIVQKYKSQILPSLLGFEQERKKILLKTLVVVLCAIGITLITFFIGLFFSQIEIISRITAIAALIVIIYQIFKVFDFKKTVKRSIMLAFCECFDDLKWFDDFYNPQTDNFLADSNLFYTDSSSCFKYDDVFTGSFDNVPFSICELESYTVKTVRTKDGVQRRKNIEFKGVVIKLKMNKNFKGNTIIKPDNFLHFIHDSALKRTTLEDVEFEKKFDVFTTDEIEARYLITASFMERIKNVQAAFFIKDVSCAFYDDSLVIGLHSYQNLFEPVSLFKSFNDYSQFSKMTKEIISIYKLIDYFKLNEKIGL